MDVYDVGEFEGRHYIVMEYVRGRTLKQLISQRGALHQEEAVNIMIQLTSAVQHAHETILFTGISSLRMFWLRMMVR